MNTMTAPRQITVGDRAGSGPARVAGEVLAAEGIALPDGSGLLGNAVADLLTQPIAHRAARRTALGWSAPAPVDTDTAVCAESLLTRVEVSRDAVTVDRHVRLLDDTGAVREQGTETWLLADPSTARPDARLDFCTPRWGELLRESLGADSDFATALSSWDGTIGLCCVDGTGRDRVVHLRIYRGRILDVTGRAPNGATFTFQAPARTWVEMMLGERNDFMRRALRGEFSSTGAGYEYLRLTKPLNLVIAHGRAIAARLAVAVQTEETHS